jgi:hypothetical protein
MTAFKRSQAEYVKHSYKTTNWPEYEAGLRQRGSLSGHVNHRPDRAQTSIGGLW